MAKAKVNVVIEWGSSGYIYTDEPLVGFDDASVSSKAFDTEAEAKRVAKAKGYRVVVG